MLNQETPGMRIRKIRQSMGISPDELSEMTGPNGPSADTIARIEAGLVRPFGLFLQYIAEALNVTRLYIESGHSVPEDELVSFAQNAFSDLSEQRRFVSFARDASFRNRSLTPEELRVLKREYLRRRTT